MEAGRGLGSTFLWRAHEVRELLTIKLLLNVAFAAVDVHNCSEIFHCMHYMI